jgi:hypothetical protein
LSFTFLLSFIGFSLQSYTSQVQLEALS